MTKTKIIIIEDENIVAKDLQLSLQSLGYEVPCTASSDIDAVKLAKLHKPDIILMDIVLKGDVRKRAYVYLCSRGYNVKFAEN